MHLPRMVIKIGSFIVELCDYGCKRRFLMTQHEKTQKTSNAQKCSKMLNTK